MTSSEFSEIAMLVVALWPRWAYVDPKCPDKSNWNQANRNKIFNLLKHYAADDCVAGLKKQSLWDPDATKPSWSSLLTDLRSQTSIRGSTPKEKELEERAYREYRRMYAWGVANKHRLDEITREAVRHRPRLKEALKYGRKLHGDLRVWVCEQWDKGDRFEDFASEDDPDAESDQSEIPF